jgi:hypothetical protein
VVHTTEPSFFPGRSSRCQVNRTGANFFLLDSLEALELEMRPPIFSELGETEKTQNWEHTHRSLRIDSLHIYLNVRINTLPLPQCAIPFPMRIIVVSHFQLAQRRVHAAKCGDDLMLVFHRQLGGF